MANTMTVRVAALLAATAITAVGCAKNDTPIGSAVYVIPPGVQPGEYLGRQLIEAAASER
jgi:hypothetical protein